MKAFIVFWVDGKMTMSVEDLAYYTIAAASEAAKALGHKMCADCKEAAGNVGNGIVNVWEQWVGTGPSYQFTIDGIYAYDIFVKEIDVGD